MGEKRKVSHLAPQIIFVCYVIKQHTKKTIHISGSYFSNHAASKRTEQDRDKIRRISKRAKSPRFRQKAWPCDRGVQFHSHKLLSICNIPQKYNNKILGIKQKHLYSRKRKALSNFDRAAEFAFRFTRRAFEFALSCTDQIPISDHNYPFAAVSAHF